MMPRQPPGGDGGCGLGWVGSFRISNMNGKPPKTVYSFFLKTHNGIGTLPILGMGGTETHSCASERGATIGFSGGDQAK